MTAYRSLSTWRGDGPFGAWLTRIAVRIALREAGKRKTIRWRDTGAANTETVDPIDRAVDRASIEASATTDPRPS